MSPGQSLRNGSSVEPGLPNTFLMPNARNRSSVACLTVVAFVVFGFSRDKVSNPLRHHHDAVPRMVGSPLTLAVHRSSPDEICEALTENSLPSNNGCSPRYTK